MESSSFWSQVFTIAFPLFLLMDSIGNVPLFLALLKDVPHRRQKIVITRELLIALLIIILFNFFGESFLNFLNVSQHTVLIAGGIILFLIALKMIFPSRKDQDTEMPREKEPFIVPLAIPLIAGPAVLAAVILYSKQEHPLVTMTAIAVSWAASLIILLSSTFLKKILGWKGLTACERLMGLLLTLIAVQMLMQGIGAFLLSFAKNA